jgi:hypothetical protein
MMLTAVAVLLINTRFSRGTLITQLVWTHQQCAVSFGLPAEVLLASYFLPVMFFLPGSFTMLYNMMINMLLFL